MTVDGDPVEEVQDQGGRWERPFPERWVVREIFREEMPSELGHPR